MNEIIYLYSCVHVNRNGDSSSGEREGDTQKSVGARDKRSILLSLSDSEAEDNDRFVLYLALHLNTDASSRLVL